MDNDLFDIITWQGPSGYIEEIAIYSKKAIDKIRFACKLSADVLLAVKDKIIIGASTKDLDDFCHDFIIARNGIPAALNYKGFPKSICTSVNEVACHGIPCEEKILKNGDIINVDCATILDGWFGDASRMFTVGTPTIRGKRISEAAKQVTEAGIAAVMPGNFVGDIGHATQKEAEKLGYSIVKQYCGHGVGRKFHDGPQVLPLGKPKTGPKLIPGMIFTIEPIINDGSPKVSIGQDGWTVKSSDNSLSAQYEHTVLVTDEGCEILTLPD